MVKRTREKAPTKSPTIPLQLEPEITKIPLCYEQAEQLTENLRASQEINQNLQQQLNDQEQKIAKLTNEKETLQQDLRNSDEQNALLH